MDFKLDSHVPDNQGKPGTETLVSLGKCMSTLVNLCGDITEIFSIPSQQSIWYNVPYVE